MVETRCISNGIEEPFFHYLIYGDKVRNVARIRMFHQGEGAVNSLRGLNPSFDHSSLNITGSLSSFWRLLTEDGRIVNWDGQVRLF
jgi:hypothetical protein